MLPVAALLNVVRSSWFKVWKCAVFSVAAMAAPLSLIEVGDFDNGSPGPIIGTLDVGLNTVSGSVYGVTFFPAGDFQDSFRLILPSGLTVTSARVLVTNFTYGNGAAIWQNGAVFFPGFQPIAGNGTYVYPAVTSEYSGSLDISVLPPASTNNPDSLSRSEFVAGGFNYTLEYQVAAVPEPSTIALIGIGLCVVVTKRRCRRI